MKLLLAVTILLTLHLAQARILDHGNRITNGNLAEAGQFPYQVGLNVSFGNASTWCGGTLVSHRWILTAAHCMDGAERATIYLGAINITDRHEAGQKRYYVTRSHIVVHANWTASTVANDIALVKLPTFVEFSDRVRAADLPRGLNGSYSSYEQATAYASGWGRDSDSSNSMSATLRYVAMPVMPHSRCKLFWGGSLSEKMICMSTSSGRSTCHGDSGGPLIYKEDSNNYLIGITSFGLSMGCEIGFPSIFTRVTSYLDWIWQHIGGNSTTESNF
ncbi:serine protease 3-like [Drosophila novamexicana]|uniref:serine protease 3-like n=1 Tax=Drosophila novamexicana TaxID=47314 RepID=UPI0011E5BB41|nr:serine protease 3-like [Drosophila novamexicana]